MRPRKSPFAVKRGYGDRRLNLAGALSPYDNGFGVKVAFSVSISTAEARELAAALVAQADVADADADKKEAAKARREKWREREIAAGRMVSISLADFLGKNRLK